MRTIRNEVWILVGLVAVLVLTRVGHFGTAWTPPNATLAVYFLGGLALGSYRFFGLLAGICIATDVLALSTGTSAACVSPAYAFMVPAHLALFVAGRFAGKRGASMPLSAFALASGTATFFFVSNASFYLLSEHFVAMGPGEYASRVVRYFPSYLGVAAVYVGVALAARWTYRRLATPSAETMRR